MLKTIRKLLINLALLLVTLALGFALCEAVVRVLYKDETVLFPRYHTDYQYGRYTIRGIRADSRFRHTSVDGSWEFVTNNHGFRNTRDFDYAKPQGVVRVLSLGDSHTQGYEVRQDATFSAVLERYLGQRGVNAQVINAGVSGFSTAEALVFLENEGHRYAPDAVLLGFYANDFDDNLKAGLFALGPGGSLVEKKHEHIPGVRIQNVIYALAPMRWLSENSYFYSLLFNTTWNFFKAQLTEAARGKTEETGTQFEYAVASADKVSLHQTALAAALIERMHRFCASRGIRFIVIDVPVRNGPYRFASSLPPALAERLDRTGVEIMRSGQVFEGLNGAAALHAPHGHHHISELAHALIGVEAGRRITRR